MDIPVFEILGLAGGLCTIGIITYFLYAVIDTLRHN